jgi:predicted patatin/cPLA2 family phospholipase
MAMHDRVLCVLAQGGGMTTAYHAGVIKAFCERNWDSEIDCIVASSGAAATYAYLVSGQPQLVSLIWETLISSGEFVRWRMGLPVRGSLHIDYLVDEIIKKRFPLDLQASQQPDGVEGCAN